MFGRVAEDGPVAVKKMALVFGLRRPTVLTVDKPWYQKLFRHRQKLDLGTTPARADHGDADAQFSLGLKYANGGGAAPDYEQAAACYLKAAEQNHAQAQFNLGVLYAWGQGVPQDDIKAVMWIQKAAQQGIAEAQFNLGMRHYRVMITARLQDVPESKIEAYKWLHLAAAQGFEGSAAACDCVALVMTREEVTDGNRRLATFATGHSDHPQVQP